MSLADDLYPYVMAGYSGLWVRTDEPTAAARQIEELAWSERIRRAYDPDVLGLPAEVYNYDLAAGLGSPQDVEGRGRYKYAAMMPTKAVDTAFGSTPGRLRFLLLQNPQLYLVDKILVQSLCNALQAGKALGFHVFCLSPSASIPLELQRLFVTADHPLPDREQLTALAISLPEQTGIELPETQVATAVNAVVGLTAAEAENALALSLAKHNGYQADTLWGVKAGVLKQAAGLELYRGHDNFTTLGGLQPLKDFCRRALTRKHAVAKPRGVALLGVPGSGKSAFAKALGNEVGLPTLQVDVGSLFGSKVGETEDKTRRVLATIDAMSPCICFIDEAEKLFSGTGSSDSTDGGVTSRMFGAWLTWMNDRTSDSFLILTANDISKLPPEFLRTERFDGIFFVDLPTAEERAAIWEIYRQLFQIAETDTLPPDQDWTGAEIRSCCRLAALLGDSLTEAARQIVPVAVTAAEKLNALRAWAESRCLSAQLAGIYSRDQSLEQIARSTAAQNGRKVRRISAAAK